MIRDLRIDELFLAQHVSNLKHHVGTDGVHAVANEDAHVVHLPRLARLNDQRHLSKINSYRLSVIRSKNKLFSTLRKLMYGAGPRYL